MAKDKTQGMQRIDLRVPDHIYNQIETIAIANKLPFSPTTKPNRDGSLKTDKDGNVIQPKVSVSPIILDLINLGLKAIAKLLRDEHPDYNYLKNIFRHLCTELDIRVTHRDKITESPHGSRIVIRSIVIVE